MKRFYIILLFAYCIQHTSAQDANQNLSNLLSPTSVNVALLPKNDSSINLGSTAKSWRDIYLDGSVYIVGARFISAKGAYNFFAGADAGINNAGSYNSFLGYQAGHSTGEGFKNVFIGSFAGHENKKGHDNVFIGDDAGFDNDSVYNAFVGARAGFNNTSGKQNTFLGALTGFNNSQGNFNTFLGAGAGDYNTTGFSNVAIGIDALHNDSNGHNLVAVGDSALYNQSGNSEDFYTNTAIGSKALFSNLNGFSNTAGGFSALYSNTSGLYNAAYGSFSLFSNTTGESNTSTGNSALYQNTKGTGNTAIGEEALIDNTVGNNNTALGYIAGVAKGNLHNAMALGYYASVNASNKAIIGNTDVTVIGGQVGWSKFSDGRFKTNVQQNVPGLAFINKLKPVTYTVELKKFDQFLGKKDSLINNMQSEYAIAEKKIHTGLIAQEVERTAKEINYDFDGVNAPQNDKDNYSLVYADFVPSLIKAVQELSAKNEELQKRIEKLEATTNIQSVQTSGSQTTTLSNEWLEQNIPNPFTNTTTIGYYLPGKFSSAKIIVTDKTGKQLKQLNLSGAGKGTIHIDASTLASGAYNYALYVDGRFIASKQMERLK